MGERFEANVSEVSLQETLDLPPPFLLGPYRAVSLHPWRGKGAAYRAIHVRSGEPATLFLMPGLELTQRERARSSFYARRSLEHPNVARLQAEGFLEECPWFATDVHEGIPLSFSLMLPRRPPSQPRSAAPISDTLVSVHAPPQPLAPANRVHMQRALQDGQIDRLLRVGFQLCSALAALHEQGFLHGSLGTDSVLQRRGDDVPILMDPGLWDPLIEGALDPVGVPPEVFSGEPIDVRADVRALGLLLYEIFAGLPFSEVLEGGIPVPLGSLVNLPQPLCQLIHRMLATDPGERPGSASECGRELMSFLSKVEVRPSLPRPRFTAALERAAGRPALVAELGELLFQEQERAVFLQVEPEIDLSTLLDSLQAQATLRGFRVHHARPCSRSLPFEAFGAALLALEDPEFPDSDAPAWDDLGILPSIAREAHLDAAELALGEAPVLFLFEGIEALDVLSRALLLRLLRSGQSHRFVLASEGPWCLPVESPPRLLVPRVRGYELEVLLKATLAVSRLPSGLLEAFQERGQHDPWTLEQQLASLLERGFLARDGEGGWRACRGAGRLGAADLLPIDRLLPERLERVPAVARRLLAAVALLREPAPLPWLLRVADLEAEEPAALEALEWLLRNRWLLRGSSKLLGLSVGAVEGPAVALLDGVERQRMHERALLLFRGAPDLWSLGRALRHAKEAGDLGTSIDLHEEVGRLAWRQGGPREAGYHWQEAHALAVRFRAPALRIARLLRRRGIALAAVGDEPQAHQLTSQALQHLDASRPALPLALRAWGSGPKASDELSREQVLAHTQLALLLTPSSSDRLRAAWSALQLAEQLPAVPRSLALAQGVLEELIERTPLGTLSLPGLQQARRRLQQQATPPQEAVRWVRQGLFLLKQGRWPQAEQALRRGASRAQRLRAQSLWLFAVTHLAFALLVQGELGQAEDLAETFVVHAFDEPDAAWLARCLRAEVALVQGRHAQALDRLVAPAPSSGRLQARVQGLRSLALLRAGQADAALQAAAQVTLDHPSLLDAEALLCALQVLCDARALRSHAPLLLQILAALRPLAEEAPILAPRLHLVELLTGQGRHRVEAILEEARRMDIPYASAQALQVLGQQRHDQGAEEALREAEALLRRLRG